MTEKSESEPSAAVDRGPNPPDESEDASANVDRRPPYVESPVITTAARTVTPFVFVYGASLTLHGGSLPGGGFQGGVIVGSTFVLIALSFGLEPTERWLDDGLIVAGLLFGIGAFATLAVGGIALGGGLLDAFVFPGEPAHLVELLELAIGVLVAASVVALVFRLAAGVQSEGDRSDTGDRSGTGGRRGTGDRE
ncbi:MAG: MnhB domain-containing protein [Haloferacaceae archaeon]